MSNYNNNLQMKYVPIYQFGKKLRAAWNVQRVFYIILYVFSHKVTRPQFISKMKLHFPYITNLLTLYCQVRSKVHELPKFQS